MGEIASQLKGEEEARGTRKATDASGEKEEGITISGIDVIIPDS